MLVRCHYQLILGLILFCSVGLLQAQAPDAFRYLDYPTNTIEIDDEPPFLFIVVEIRNFPIPASGETDYVGIFDADDPTQLIGNGEAFLDLNGRFVSFAYVNQPPSGDFFVVFYDDTDDTFYPLFDSPLQSGPERIVWQDLVGADGTPPGDFFVDGWSQGQFNDYPGELVPDPINSSTDIQDIWNFLPVEYVYFQAERQAATVLLKWGTASESGSDRFEVERSLDGRTFDYLGRVEAAGHSESLLDYHFVDAQPATGWNYYRLKQIDTDGSSVYSEVVLVDIERDAIHDIRLYPNPVSGQQLSISFLGDWPIQSKLQLRLLDMQGRKLAQWDDTTASSRSLRLPQLAPGLYQLVVVQDGDRHFQRLMVR